MPAVTLTAEREGEKHRLQLSVLTYNIEGLGWPARKSRGARLREIGARLNVLLRSGAAPDIVLFQEVFSKPAIEAVKATGYPALAAGPQRTTRADSPKAVSLPGKPMLSEWGIHLTGGGLVVASRFPIAAEATTTFGRNACAGRDCLANKGVMLVRINVQGLPQPIDIYNTHMNSRKASGASQERHLEAHDRQALAVSSFIDRTHNDAAPVILGGDFNMRRSEERWDNFSRYQSLTLVHRTCADPRSRCDVRMSWDGDAPWMDTQDLQFYGSGAAVHIRPIVVEALFDGSPNSPKLSDHDGFLVTYELSW